MVRKVRLSRHLERRGFLRVTHFFGCLSLLLLLPMSAFAAGSKPNILVIFGDDVGQTDISAYSMGVMGFKTPNIDRIAKEGMMFTDYYAENSCTAGRSSFITGQAPFAPDYPK
jgi:arylsulfatase